MDLVSVVPSLGQPLSLSHIEISAGSPALVCQPITGSVIMLTWPTYSVTRWCGVGHSGKLSNVQDYGSPLSILKTLILLTRSELRSLTILVSLINTD